MTEEKSIYLFDKTTNRTFIRRSSKRVFSEEMANSSIINDSVDHSYLENDLKENFEDKFGYNFNVISQMISNPGDLPKDYTQAILSLAQYGIIGDLRNPVHKKETDLTSTKLINLIKRLGGHLDEVLYYEDKMKQIKYSNMISYSDISKRIVTKMGKLNFNIYNITSENDFFILPDTSAITLRAKINTYFNPDIEEIAIIGIPLSSKIFLQIESSKLRESNSCLLELDATSFEEIQKINFALLDRAYKQVACESKEFLLKLISNHSYIREKYNHQ